MKIKTKVRGGNPPIDNDDPNHPKWDPNTRCT